MPDVFGTLGADGRLIAGAFAEYARLQRDLGVELAQQHVADLTGCCRACGRVFPCDGFEHGQYMRAHFDGWLNDRPGLGTVVADPLLGLEPRAVSDPHFGLP